MNLEVIGSPSGPSRKEPERLARLARMRWKMELDYKQLKGELGPSTSTD